MEQHELGRTGRQVSVVGLGTWQLGADWGEVSEADALRFADSPQNLRLRLLGIR